jgi:light-harvesting complex I chlorophyll a/b binding protein 3
MWRLIAQDDMDKMKLKEIKNGRAAMLAMLGFAAQASMTGVGPYQNLMDHLGNPTGANLLTNLGSVGGSL